MAAIQMLNEDERHSAVGWHPFKEVTENFQTAGGCTCCYNGTVSIRVTWFLAGVAGCRHGRPLIFKLHLTGANYNPLRLGDFQEQSHQGKP
jgi:hypothetical protein